MSSGLTSTLASFAPEARDVLDAMLSKFVDVGATELSPRPLEVPPISMGSVTELAARFDGAVRPALRPRRVREATLRRRVTTNEL